METKSKVPGVNYLSNSPKTERLLAVPDDHVLIKRSDWLEVIEFFETHPELIKELGAVKVEL